jgi:hypothetical protein
MSKPGRSTRLIEIETLAAALAQIRASAKAVREQYLAAVHDAAHDGTPMRSMAFAECRGRGVSTTRVRGVENNLRGAVHRYRKRTGQKPSPHRPKRAKPR